MSGGLSVNKHLSGEEVPCPESIGTGLGDDFRFQPYFLVPSLFKSEGIDADLGVVHDKEVFSRLPVWLWFNIEGVVAGAFYLIVCFPVGKFFALRRTVSFCRDKVRQEIGFCVVVQHPEFFRLFHLHVLAFHGVDEFDFKGYGAGVFRCYDIF